MVCLLCAESSADAYNAYNAVKLPARKARGFPDRNKAQFIALLDLWSAPGHAPKGPCRTAGARPVYGRIPLTSSGPVTLL